MLRTALAKLRADFTAATGHPFAHFHCPILFRDEPATLCRGHIVNSAFRHSYGHWTVMRKDVDEFFGSVCESEFVLLHDRERHRVVDVVADRGLSRLLKPAVVVGGSVIPHYLPDGPVPPGHTEFTLERPGHLPFRIALRRSTDALFAAGGFAWEIRLAKRVGAGAVASLLKAAHLTMFSLLGYSYALSPGGRFIGHDLLGRFYEDNVGRPRSAALIDASRRFARYANLVRPVVGGAAGLKGTITDGVLYQCVDGGAPWAHVTLVRTGRTLYAVMLPTLDSADSRARFEAFLRAPTATFNVKHVRFRRERWEISHEHRVFEWPAAGVA